MIKIEKVEYNQLDIEHFHDFSAKTIYTTKYWIDFLVVEKDIEPVILKIFDEDVFLGYFTGGIENKRGFKLFGSPLAGWYSAYMGFDFYDEYIDKKQEAYEIVIDYIFNDLKCVYTEITDQHLKDIEIKKYESRIEEREAYITDLTLEDDEIYKKIKRQAKCNINKFYKTGCRIEEDYSDAFVDEFYNQLTDVFAKQSLEVSYSKEMVKNIINSLKPVSCVYCIKGIAPDGQCISTLIQLGYNKKSFSFGAASYREFQKEYRPNEALIYDTIQFCKQKGHEVFDYGGGGHYKRKYGGERVCYHRYMLSKYRGMFLMKKVAVKMYWSLKKLKYSLKNIKR